MNPKISVVIIALNEEANIEKCLASCTEFDEIIVIDSGSTDKTLEISKSYGAKVFHQEWLGFGPQKQYAVSKASNNWILSIDADEYLTGEVKAAVFSSDLSSIETAYAINRRSFFLGREVKHSGWNPDWVVRLFNKNTASFTDDLVHERVTGFSCLRKLNGLMFHNTYPTFNDIEAKTKKYGALGKKSRTKNKNRYLSAAWAFLRTYILKVGFLDGFTGIRIAAMNAKTTFIKYS